MDRPDAAQVSIQSHDNFEKLVERCRQLPPVAVAVAHPCDESSLGSALEAVREGLIEAILVGPVARIRAVAEQHGFDLSGIQIEDVAHNHAAAYRAVEMINSRMLCTTDAASLCKMADRGQITGAILDGPLALDNAISKEAARIKKIESVVAGDPDIVVVPDLASGNILAKQLTFMSNADGAGIVLGARVPIILTSRADNKRAKLASCAVACLMASATILAKPTKSGA
ncbi:MAG: hypothetical protein IPK02_06300 [Candidatus Accumulibacter sp.]|uniref:Phosphate acetyl/butaryl transferase domain-containing protein n=1 Tax=Candidatus Accumulibacter affinis TaxID=2954384 RepID=A0A935TG38_9PROT|nr:hypothetical protein [Candidatus Accumulibacter affinis]